MSTNGVSGAHGTDQTTPSPPPQVVSLKDVTFDDVLRAANPLQYVPVVGTIYRLATGDSAPTGLRMAVSAISGALMGGPLGLVLNIGGMLLENFLHMEDRVRTAMAPSATPSMAAAPSRTLETGVAPGTTSQATAAYHAAGLLGAV